MSDTTPTIHTIAIGTTDTGRKVHMGYALNRMLLCAFTAAAPKLTEVIDNLSEDGGQDNTITTLLKHGIRPTRLCAGCFSIKFRATYTTRIRQELNAIAATTVVVEMDDEARTFIGELATRRNGAKTQESTS